MVIIWKKMNSTFLRLTERRLVSIIAGTASEDVVRGMVDGELSFLERGKDYCRLLLTVVDLSVV